jgi:APA family basic amino acid/polyamine antiporter
VSDASSRRAGERDVGQGAAAKEELRRVISRPMLTFFIIGDILGTGIYALVGEVGGRVGGAIWMSFLVSVLIAFITAFAYAELVTKYPHAAGAALYVNNAWGIPFLTFIVAFAVVTSGITSASAAGVTFGGDYLAEFVTLPTVGVALAFLVVLSLINFWGIRESVRLNMLLTAIELTGLAIIIVIGFVTLLSGGGDPGRAFELKQGISPPLAVLSGAALAFFAMVGFEDSVNVAEETRAPNRAFPPALFTGLLVTGCVYLLVAFTASMVVPTDRLAASSGPLLEVVKVSGSPVPAALFSLIALVAVSNSALINLIMGSRLMYGMANQGIVPRLFGKVHSARRTPLPSIVFVALIGAVLVSTADVEALGATTAALLLAVFTLVNVSVLVLRKDRVEHTHFVAPRALPVLGAICCLGLLTRQEGGVLIRAVVLLLVGVALWVVNRLITGRVATIKADELAP